MSARIAVDAPGMGLRRNRSQYSLFVILVPRRLRRLLSTLCYRSDPSFSPTASTSSGRNRFLSICVAVYAVNLLLFFSAIFTYYKLSKLPSNQASEPSDAMTIFATFRNSNNNRVMLAMNNQEIVELAADGLGKDSKIELNSPKERMSEHALKVGKLPRHYNQSGTVLLGAADLFRFSAKMSTSLIQRFPLEDRVVRMFPDESKENKLMALAPAIVQTGDRIRVFQRLWLAQNEAHHLHNKTTLNTFQENYLVHRAVSLDYETIEPSTLVPLPVTTNCVKIFTYRTDGPMDARAFTLNGTTYLSFHMWHIDAELKGPRSRMFLWNEDSRQLSKIRIRNFTLMWTEINWVPLVVESSLYFTYSFDPLRVVHCRNLTTHPVIWCDMEFTASVAPEHKFNEWVDAFRGGSPWVHYQGSYFISFAHTHYQYIKEQIDNDTIVEGGIYAGNLAVLKVVPLDNGNSAFRLVYVSDPLLFNKKLLTSGDITRSQIINWPFAFPVGAVLRNGDVADVGIHVNDARGYVVRVKGLLTLMRRVMAVDEQNLDTSRLDESAMAGQPEVGLVHRLAVESAIRLRESELSEMFP